MGQHEEKRTVGVITLFKIWVIRFVIGSCIAFAAKKADSFLDKKYGPDEYDKKIIEIWNSVKNIF